MGGDDKVMNVTKISSDMIKPFRGEGDVCAWLKKVELVAKLTKVSDEANFIPLYLEDGGLSVYMEMSSNDQASAAKIKERLLEAFSDSMFVAYTKLMATKWTGEAVDVYINELRRLAGLAGFKDDALDQLVKLSFVTGFPDDISVELQQISNVKAVAISTVLSRARILVANRGVTNGLAATSIRDKDKKSPGSKVQSGFSNHKREEGNRSFNGKCFRCYGDHMIKDCPERPDRKSIVCYRCGGEGHIATNCDQKPARNQGN